MDGSIEMQKKEMLSEIKQKLLDFKKLYPDNPVKVTFDLPVNVTQPEKIKCHITETT